MKFLALFFGVVCVAASVPALERAVRFDDYRLAYIDCVDGAVLNWLQENQVDIWERQEERVGVFIDPQKLQALKELGMARVQEVAGNIQQTIDEETARLQQRDFGQMAFESADWFSEYRPFDSIVKWYEKLALENPDLVTLIPSVGVTHEGRNILAAKITSKKTPGPKKQIYIQSLQHAREWLGGTTTMYIVDRLVRAFGRDTEPTSLLQEAEVIVVPVMNPDGYEYTWGTNRMWRKNRRNNGGAFGVDLNRNWDDGHWGQGGSSSNPGSDVYKGPSPASEPEVQAVARLFLDNPNIVAAIDYHCFSQLILRPFGWTRRDSKHEKEHKSLGKLMADAIGADSGMKYVSQKVVDLYVATGSAVDYWHSDRVAQAFGHYVYGLAIELRPKSMMEGGFVMPPSSIVPTGKESYASFLKFARFVLDNPLEI